MVIRHSSHSIRLLLVPGGSGARPEETRGWRTQGNCTKGKSSRKLGGSSPVFSKANTRYGTDL